MPTTHHVSHHTAWIMENMGPSKTSTRLEAKLNTAVMMDMYFMESHGQCASTTTESLLGHIKHQSASVSVLDLSNSGLDSDYVVNNIYTAIKCRDLDDIRYGGVRLTGNKVGSRANYYCDKGYKLVGDDHRVCLKTGHWGGKMPVCKRKRVSGKM